MKDKLYEYATLFREPGPGAVPRDGSIDYGCTEIQYKNKTTGKYEIL